MKNREIGLGAIIRDAIAREEEARRIFTEAVAVVKESGARQMLTEFAQEEVAHKQLLESIDLKALQEQPLSIPEDLMITETLANKRITEESNFQDVIIFAMHLEKTAYELYTDLARQAKDSQANKAFQWLAQEELKHKSKLEKYYDEIVYKDN